MPSTEPASGEPKPSNKEYIEIIASDSVIDKKFLEGTGLPSKIIYYCRDCQALVKPKRIGNKFEFSCTVCQGKNVSFGTENAVRKFYKIKEGKEELVSEKKAPS